MKKTFNNFRMLLSRTTLVAVLAVLGLNTAHADEGMWLLKLMEQQHLADSLRKAGLEISPDELYNENGSSLKDVVGIFGSGCTGEVVSAQGLIFTNNHCSFDYVHSMSTMEHNYLQNGFYAHSLSEELPTPELDFVFVRAIEDVTKVVEDSLADLDEYVRQSESALQPLANELLQHSRFAGKAGMRARILPYFGGNQFYIFYEQVYEDVRLVVNVPQNFGQFGENQDNWMWPRHNPDFSVFRIYADKNGEPAAYSKDNVPLHCDRFLPISLRGIENGDFTMVMGFPGSTSRYLTSAEIESRVKNLNEPINTIGNVILDHMKELMNSDPELNLSMASEYFQIGNVVKNFGGMNEAVRKIRLIDRTLDKEMEFREWAKANGKEDACDAMDLIEHLTTVYGDTIHDLYLTSFGMRRQQLKLSAVTPALDGLMRQIVEAKKKDREAIIDKALEGFEPLTAAELERDRALMKKLLKVWVKDKKLEETILNLKDVKEVDAFVDNIYDKTAFKSKEGVRNLMLTGKQNLLEADPLYAYKKSLNEYMAKMAENIGFYESAILELDKTYTGALCEKLNWTKSPDANMTLRMTYGHVCDLHPRDAVVYDYQTVIDGMFEKENPADPDYAINEDVRKLYEAKDFGRWARPDGKLPACFLSNNDITGGNSGSPVMNARGELIGIAFDGNIESLSCDLEYNPTLQRCINVDIRYVLWCIDKLGKCDYLFKEFKLVD